MVQQLDAAQGGSSKPPSRGGGGGGGSRGGGSSSSHSSAGSSYSAPAPSAPSYTHVNPQRLQPYTAPGPTALDFLKEQKARDDAEITPSARLSFGDTELNQAKYGQYPEKPKQDPKGIGLGDDFEHKYKPRKTFEMTWDDYNALSARQRGAVDFNTLLVQAREKDLNAKAPAPTEGQRLTYDKAVEDMFGKDGGSETYAPNTMAVLRQIDFNGREAGEDLDNFLGLKAAITAKDLKNFDLPKESPVTTTMREVLPDIVEPAASPAVDRNELQQTLAKGTVQLAKQIERSGNMLRSFGVSAGMAMNEDLRYFGAPENEAGLPPGFGNTEKDQFFQKAFSALAYNQNEGQLGDVWGEIRSILGPEKEMDQFVRYVDTRTSSNKLYGLDTEGGQYKSPEEFRKLLGLDKEAD